MGCLPARKAGIVLESHLLTFPNRRPRTNANTCANHELNLEKGSRGISVCFFFSQVSILVEVWPISA